MDYTPPGGLTPEVVATTGPATPRPAPTRSAGAPEPADPAADPG